tara:strand:+ start:157 stop:480 length:324 start_codon:yes stop_codon:yes gene_type:complete
VVYLNHEDKLVLAARLRALADGLLVPTATLTGLPPELVQGFVEGTTTGAVAAAKAPKKRKASAYARKYKAAFKRVAPKYKLKSGKWKAGGFKRAVKEAHKIAGGKKR